MPIELFTQPLCPYSLMTKHILRSVNLSYVERNIVSDREALKDFIRTKSAILPVLRIDDDVLVGFNPAKLLRLLYRHYGVVTPVWTDSLVNQSFHRLIVPSSPRSIFLISGPTG